MYKILFVLTLALIGCDQSTAPVQEDQPNDVVNPRWVCQEIAQGDSIVGTERCVHGDSTSVTWSYVGDHRDDGWQVVVVGRDTIISVSW